MAKRIIRRPKGKKPIKNSNLIGAGTPFKAVKNSKGETQYGPSILKQQGRSAPKAAASKPASKKPIFRASLKAKAVHNTKAPNSRQWSIRLPKASGVSSSTLKGKSPTRKAPIARKGPKR